MWTVAPEPAAAPWPPGAGSPEPVPVWESGQVVAAVTPTKLAAPMPAKVAPMTARRLTIPWPGSGGTGVGVSGMDHDLFGFGGGRRAGGAGPPVAAAMRSLWLRPQGKHHTSRGRWVQGPLQGEAFGSPVSPFAGGRAAPGPFGSSWSR